MANWDPKVNPFAGLLGIKPQRAEPPRRLSMRAMKAVDLKGLGPDDVLEVDEFSVGGALEVPAQEPGERGEAARPGGQRARAEEQAREQVAQQHAGQAKLRQGRPEAKKGMPALRPEAFGPPQAAGQDPGVQKPGLPKLDVQKLPPRPLTDPNFSALVALDNAQDPGVYFREDREREGHTEDQEDPALREAVEECIRLLFGVRGIHHVGPGRNEQDEPVIVVATSEGFSHDSMAAVPDRVHGFPTIISLSFDLVPLRRSR